MIKQVSSVAGATLGALVGLSLIFGSWYTIDQTERGVLLRNGAFVDVVQPGLHFKLPFVDDVYKIDMQTHTFTYQKVNSYSADQQPADLKVSVTLRISPDKVAEMYDRFRGDYAAALNRLVSPRVHERVKVVFGQYNAAKAITARGQLNLDAAKSLIEAISYDPIFVIESVQIENIDFSSEYIKSVEQRMQAEVEVQRLHQNLAREKVQADIVVTQAKARADAVRAEAQAAADAIKLRGDAEAQAIQARGKALGDNPSLVALVQAEKWDGKLPVSMPPAGTVPFLTVK